MLNHIATPTSDHKNGGWRLIERLRAIGHVDRPQVHVLAFGTLEAFHKSCLSSNDGRSVLKSRDNLGRLLNDRYKGEAGKPWNGWECRFYVSYVDCLHQHLLLSVDLVVAGRPVEDAARGRRPAACMLLLACAHVCASPSRDPVLLTVIQRLLL